MSSALYYKMKGLLSYHIYNTKVELSQTPVFDKLDTLFTDAEIKGFKRGYEKASNEYRKVYKGLEQEYHRIIQNMENKKNKQNNTIDCLILELERLEKIKVDIEKQVNSKMRVVSLKYDISIKKIQQATANETILIGCGSSMTLFGIIYKYKEKKLRVAEERGYAEAKEIFMKKIELLKMNFQKLMLKEVANMEERASLISDIFNEIAKIQIQIAELEILL